MGLFRLNKTVCAGGAQCLLYKVFEGDADAQ
jgi:hypothetical protein